MNNPYLNRVAIKDPAHFFGRSREVAKIFSRLAASRPQSISIVGDRRIGKSSLLNYICNKTIRARFIDAPSVYAFVFIDLQQKRRLSLKDFLREIFISLGADIGEPAIAQMEPVLDSLRATLDRFRAEDRKLVIVF